MNGHWKTLNDGHGERLSGERSVAGPNPRMILLKDHCSQQLGLIVCLTRRKEGGRDQNLKTVARKRRRKERKEGRKERRRERQKSVYHAHTQAGPGTSLEDRVLKQVLFRVLSQEPPLRVKFERVLVHFLQAAHYIRSEDDQSPLEKTQN